MLRTVDLSLLGIAAYRRFAPIAGNWENGPPLHGNPHFASHYFITTPQGCHKMDYSII